ncbi:zinc ribbon domain-containing protein [Helicobacter salomonis]|uniref:zinc ribbon domain-containing protein n=1 Tax=Helicobacter salomonis TaxID=56878 RepID=UPI003F6A5224
MTFSFVVCSDQKASWKGKTLLKIDQYFPSSQICCTCGSNTGTSHSILEILSDCQTHHHSRLTLVSILEIMLWECQMKGMLSRKKRVAFSG